MKTTWHNAIGKPISASSAEISVPGTGDSLDNSYHVIRAIGTLPQYFYRRYAHFVGTRRMARFLATAMEGEYFYPTPTPKRKPISTFATAPLRTIPVGKEGRSAVVVLGEQPLLPQFYNCHFAHNRTINIGGAFFKQGTNAEADTLHFSHCTFENNTSWIGGGAIHYDSFCQPLKLNNGNFVNNSTISQGGAISLISYCNKGWLTIDSCLFQNNTGNVGGAVILVQANFTSFKDTAIINIENSRFLNNVATFQSRRRVFLDLQKTVSFLNLNNCHFKENMVKAGEEVFI
ncbi:MAG: hypothetical protein H6559_19000 [Lewinellaceae bacterium]|nr:hypothetical protein [Lewinellaceae bacterium]